MSDARWYAVWPKPRSRSRSLKGSRPSVPHGTNFFILFWLAERMLSVLWHCLFVGWQDRHPSGRTVQGPGLTSSDLWTNSPVKQQTESNSHCSMWVCFIDSICSLCVSQLNAGVTEKICLSSRDDDIVLVVSYAELKRCVETSFAELTAAPSAQTSTTNYT